MLLAVAVGIATALIVTSVIVVVVASLVVITITTLIVAMPLVLMTRRIVGPLILCVRGSATERRERDRQRRHSNSTALMGSRHGLLLRVCLSHLYHSAHQSATLTAFQAVLRHMQMSVLPPSTAPTDLKLCACAKQHGPRISKKTACCTGQRLPRQACAEAVRISAAAFSEAHMYLSTLARLTFAAAAILLVAAAAGNTDAAPRRRAPELGIKVGVLSSGPLDAITDVAGVMVGQTTIVRGDNIRTGVTAVVPHAGNLYREKVPGAISVGNGYGKLAGATQVEELGEIETPILLTSTVAVPRVADALISYMLQLPGNEDVLSVNPVVGETNDGFLNDIRGRHIAPEDVFAALRGAHGGPVEEGAVGAGTGTVAFGWKGGIGTASRRLPARLGGYTVGVLVQTNFGGVLTIAGAPVGVELGQYYLREQLTHRRDRTDRAGTADGSCMIVLATDAPLGPLELKRLASRALLGMVRAGSSASNGSGDYAIAFSTAPEVRIHMDDKALTRKTEVVTTLAMSPLFEAAIEATEEAIYNSMLKATTTSGNGHTVEALPIERVIEILRQHQLLH